MRVNFMCVNLMHVNLMGGMGRAGRLPRRPPALNACQLHACQLTACQLNGQDGFRDARQPFLSSAPLRIYVGSGQVSMSIHVICRYL